MGIFCLLVLIATLVSGSAGSNPKYWTREDWPKAYWAIVAVMAITTAGLSIEAFHG